MENHSQRGRNPDRDRFEDMVQNILSSGNHTYQTLYEALKQLAKGEKYADQTFEKILSRMMNRVPNRDRREGSLVWDGNASSAIELQHVYIALDNILTESFGDTASREFLIRRARERDIVPFPASRAVLKGLFTPTDIDMTGRRFSMPNTPLTYTVERRLDDVGSIPEQSPEGTTREVGGTYQVRCDQFGLDGNLFLRDIIPLPIAGNNHPRVQTATLVDVLIPAQEEEETEALRQRYFDSFNNNASNGNRHSYYQNTRPIEGVGSVKVTPVWNGGGTVLVTILDTQYNPATDVLIHKVQQILDPTQDGYGLGLAAIGHRVTVRTADLVAVYIATQLTLLNGFTLDMVQDQIETVIEAYLLELRRDWENQDIVTQLGLFQNSLFVMISQLNSRILNIHGVLDIQNTTINGLPQNLEIEKYAIPVLGGISL